MSKPWIFISPASRGIGHALATHLLRTTTLPILATARQQPNNDNNNGLSAVKESLLDANASQTSREDSASRLHVTHLDVTDEESIRCASGLAAELFPPSTHHLHLAFALPGVLHAEKHPARVDYADAVETFRVNTLGPLMLMKWFGDLLPRKGTDLSRVEGVGEGEGILPANHATWVTNSARVGSTAENRLGGWYTYRASKAGVNSITKTFDLHLRARCGEKAMAVAYHPGTVRTQLSREFWKNVPDGQLFGPEMAVRKMMEVVAGRTDGDRGKCWDWRGEEVPP